MHRSIPILATALLATPLAAQVIVPAARASSEGSTSSSYPWARTTLQIRNMYCWDSSHFTGYGITGPVLISGVRFRANGTTTTYTGGSYSNVVIDMSTSVADYAALSTTFDNNHGLDRSNVLNGSVTVGASPGGTPGPWYVDIDFAVPFSYDPSLGDLLMDVRFPAGSWTGGTAPVCDYESGSTVAFASRIYSLTAWSGTPAVPPATGTFTNNYAGIADFKVSGFANAGNYGTGCVNRRTSIYEFWTAGPTDLGTTTGTNALLFTPNGLGGYTVTAGPSTFYAPTTPDLLLGDDAVSAALALPFAFAYPGGSTSAIKICSNGFVHLDANQTITDLSPSVAELLAQAPRIFAQWGDLDPAEIDPTTTLPYGSIHFDVDPVSSDAIATWLHVPQYDSSTTNPRKPNTFQIVLHGNGSFELRYQDCQSANALLVGFGEGGGGLDPGAADLSGAFTTPFDSGLRALPLQLSASARPLIGGPAMSLVVDNLAAGSPFGVVLLSFTRFNPGLDLTPAGMPGCAQYCGLDFAFPFAPAGSSFALPLPIPNTPALSGLPFASQAASVAPHNALGVTASNGVALTLGTL